MTPLPHPTIPDRPWLKFLPQGWDFLILHGHSWWIFIFETCLQSLFSWKKIIKYFKMLSAEICTQHAKHYDLNANVNISDKNYKLKNNRWFNKFPYSSYSQLHYNIYQEHLPYVYWARFFGANSIDPKASTLFATFLWYINLQTNEYKVNKWIQYKSFRGTMVG